ncbi:hypothetical protein [Megasphaera sp.]|jgi:hypothetical protein|uniref:hypothetical protein n=1 Tax=Megasphaera sp. TaxID=2023260 RepID=UPI003A5C0EED
MLLFGDDTTRNRPSWGTAPRAMATTRTSVPAFFSKAVTIMSVIMPSSSPASMAFCWSAAELNSMTWTSTPCLAKSFSVSALAGCQHEGRAGQHSG